MVRVEVQALTWLCTAHATVDEVRITSRHSQNIGKLNQPVLVVFAIVEVADDSLLPTISLNRLASNELILQNTGQGCGYWSEHGGPTYIAIFVLVGIPLLIVWGLFRNHKKDTVRPGHTWMQTYRGGFYWFE
jgi:hypothetical protein